VSLRDQLLKAGIVDKKKVRDVNRALKDKRRQEQAHKERRKEIEAREAEARQQALEAELERTRLERARRVAVREQQDRKRLVSNLLNAYKLPDRRGPQPFFHLTPDRHHAHRLWLPESFAWDLRRGALAVAWMGEDPENPDYVLLPAPAARRVATHEPQRVLFLNDGPPDDPSEALYEAAPTR